MRGGKIFVLGYRAAMHMKVYEAKRPTSSEPGFSSFWAAQARRPAGAGDRVPYIWRSVSRCCDRVIAPGPISVGEDPAPVATKPVYMEREAICRSALLRLLWRRGTAVRAGVKRYVKEFAEWFPEVDAENILHRYPRGLTGWCTRTEKIIF